MSNQVGLMLSFVFLSFLIIFSGELIAYQQKYAIFLNNSNQIAYYLQIHGYDERYLDTIQLQYDMRYVKCEYIETTYDEKMVLTCCYRYNSITSLFDYISGDLICTITIYR